MTIRGPKDDVAKAKKMLLELANEKQLSSMTAEVRAKPEHHKFLIGRNGSNVQAIRDKTGARIIFPTEKDKDKETITILGTKEAVAAAKQELEAKIKGLVSGRCYRHAVPARNSKLEDDNTELKRGGEPSPGLSFESLSCWRAAGGLRILYRATDTSFI